MEEEEWGGGLLDRPIIPPRPSHAGRLADVARMWEIAWWAQNFSALIVAISIVELVDVDIATLDLECVETDNLEASWTQLVDPLFVAHDGCSASSVELILLSWVCFSGFLFLLVGSRYVVMRSGVEVANVGCGSLRTELVVVSERLSEWCH